MVLYEFLCIVRKQGGLQEAKDIARGLGTIVVRRGGVVRKFVHWGELQLPERVRRHQQVHDYGRYFMMYFDSSPWTQAEIRRISSLDPRIVRHMFVKIGHKLEDVLHIPGFTDKLQSTESLKHSSSETGDWRFKED